MAFVLSDWKGLLPASEVPTQPNDLCPFWLESTSTGPPFSGGGARLGGATAQSPLGVPRYRPLGPFNISFENDKNTLENL